MIVIVKLKWFEEILRFHVRWIRMPLVLILSKRRMRFLLGHSRIPLHHLHILVTEHLADGLHRHTCLQRNEAGERVSSRMVGIGKSVLFSTSKSKAFWMESNNCSMSLLVSTASLLLFSFGYYRPSTIYLAGDTFLHFPQVKSLR